MEDALRDLPGVSGLETDFKNDAFRISYDPTKTSPKAMLVAIESVGFEGRIVDAAELTRSSGSATIAIEALPQDIQNLAREAREFGKLLLIDFHGPG